VEGSGTEFVIRGKGLGGLRAPAGPLDAGMFACRSSARFENFRIQSNDTH